MSAITYPNGYSACAAWWRDFSERIYAAEGYAIDPKLREAVQALPADQLGDFLDALGETLVCWMCAGEPTAERTSNPARVAFCKLPPLRTGCAVQRRRRRAPDRSGPRHERGSTVGGRQP